MKLEDHPKALLAILVLALGAGGIGAGRTMNAGAEAGPAAPAHAQACRLQTPTGPMLGGDSLPLHEVMGGVGLATALAAGVKVDSGALPAALADAIGSGVVSLKSPATMVLLLRLDAVVGLKATFESAEGHDKLARVEVTCALCHSTVDDSVAPGIGRRRDGMPNHDLDAGALAALSPSLPKVRKAIRDSSSPARAQLYRKG